MIYISAYPMKKTISFRKLPPSEPSPFIPVVWMYKARKELKSPLPGMWERVRERGRSIH